MPHRLISARPAGFFSLNIFSASTAGLLTDHRDPNLATAQARAPVESLVVTFQRRPVSGLVSRVRQPMLPDCPERSGDRGYVFAMLEDRISLRRNSNPRELLRFSRKLANLNSANIIVSPRIVGVIDRAIRRTAGLSFNLTDVKNKAVPLRRDPGMSRRGTPLPQPEINNAPCRTRRGVLNEVIIDGSILFGS